jgi:hypothetical protein
MFYDNKNNSINHLIIVSGILLLYHFHKHQKIFLSDEKILIIIYFALTT